MMAESSVVGTQGATYRPPFVNFPVELSSPCDETQLPITLGVDGSTRDLTSTSATQLAGDGEQSTASSLNALLDSTYAGGVPAAVSHIKGGETKLVGVGVGTGTDIGASVGVGADGSSMRAPSASLGAGISSSYGDASLRLLIETKERELHDIHDYRIRCQWPKQSYSFILAGLITAYIPPASRRPLWSRCSAV